MKKIIAALAISFVAYSASAKLDYRNYRQSCPKFYVGLSTGLDNHSGLIGPNFDIPVTGRFSLGAGVGLSTWGYKSYGEARFYFKDCNRGWAIGVGGTYSTGLQNFSTLLPTTVGDQDVLLDLEPVANVAVSGYRFFSMGPRHRFYLQLGYSHRFQSTPYTVKSPHVLTSDGKTVMNILAPGGVIFAFGFSFGLGG